jgi:non-ribosomal peptide synthetase component E (peptide arylation enzyme)
MNMDASGWATRLDADLVREHTASGKWTGVTLRDCAIERAAEAPDAVWLVDGNVRLTFGQALTQALTLATELRARGLVPGDVVSFQLPNWPETGVINLACAIGGFVCNPIVPI